MSHGREKDEGGSKGRARELFSAIPASSEPASVAAPTDEELQVFLPLPTETVKLERV